MNYNFIVLNSVNHSVFTVYSSASISCEIISQRFRFPDSVEGSFQGAFYKFTYSV